MIWMLVVYLFLAFWLLAFMSALYQFSIAYAAASWYCAPRKEGSSTRKAVNQCALFEGVRIGLWYHTGSLAVGAGLIAFLELLQRVLEWAEKKQQMEGSLTFSRLKLLSMCYVLISSYAHASYYVLGLRKSQSGDLLHHEVPSMSLPMRRGRRPVREQDPRIHQKQHGKHR